MKNILIKMIKETEYSDLCSADLGCVGVGCHDCPFHSEENKQKLIDELEAGQ